MATVTVNAAYGAVQFSLQQQGIALEFLFNDCFDEDVWRGLADGEQTDLTISDVHGYVSLLSDGSTVTFSVSKTGDHGDGNISIEVPFSSCADVFATCLSSRVWEPPGNFS